MDGMHEEALAWDKERCSHSWRVLADSHPKVIVLDAFLACFGLGWVTEEV